MPRVKASDRKRGEVSQSAAFDKLIASLGEVENATLVQAPPPGAYSYELKYDGYRILALKIGEEVRLISRRAQDWTDEFRDIASAIAKLEAHELALDGEVVAVDERGVPSFQKLQRREGGSSYILFDLLWLEGQDVRAQPLEARRAQLERLIGEATPTLGLSRSVSGDAGQLLEAACRAGFEGLIGKRAGSAYRPGRGLDWIKLKCQLRQEFAIIGYLPYTGTRRGVVGGAVARRARGGGLCVRRQSGYGLLSTNALGTWSASRAAPYAEVARSRHSTLRGAGALL